MAFEKIRKILSRKKALPEGLWQKCPGCTKMIYKKELEERKMVCAECGHHFTLSHQERLGQMLDADSFREMWGNLESCDPLKFEGITSYREKHEQARKRTGLNEACITG
ncbi:MAG: acetyl-CoA carboxylase, carboxyltransferase subunit beta, partial [Planctomycetota bacterium]